MKNTKEVASSAAATNRTSGGGKGQRRKNVDTFAHNEKENVDIFATQVNLRPNETKSPLPEGYPRIPLQDITAVLQPSNIIPGEENGSGSNKPFTRAQASRKTEIVETRVLTEKTLKKNTVRAGASTIKTRQRKAVLNVYASDDSIEMQGGESAQLKEAMRLTVSLATSVQLKQQRSAGDLIRTEELARKEITVREAAESSNEEIPAKEPGHSAGAETPVMEAAESFSEEIPVNKPGYSAGAETPVKEAAKVSEDETQGLRPGEVVESMDVVTETPTHSEMEGRDRSREKAGHKSIATATGRTTGGRNENTRDQKRRKPLSGRSAVSSFR